MAIFSLFAGVIFTVLFLSKRKAEVPLKLVIVKGIASFGFIFTGLFSFLENDKCPPLVGVMVLIGAFFGLLGDVTLDLKYVYKNDADTYLRLGFSVFLIGHIFYSIAFASLYGIELKNVFLGFVGAAFNLFFVFVSEKITNVLYGKYKGITTLYAIILGFSVGLGFSYIFTEGFMVQTIMYYVGMFLFFLSDGLLSVIYFSTKEKERTNRGIIVLNHLVYYLAQYMIAVSVMFIKG